MIAESFLFNRRYVEVLKLIHHLNRVGCKFFSSINNIRNGFSAKKMLFIGVASYLDNWRMLFAGTASIQTKPTNDIEGFLEIFTPNFGDDL